MILNLLIDYEALGGSVEVLGCNPEVGDSIPDEIFH